MSNKEIVTLDKRKGAEVGELINQQIQYLLDFEKAKNILIKSIGVSILGIYYSKSGKVWAPNFPEWEEYPLLEDIQSMLNDKNIIVKIDSDRTAYILGETWLGCAVGCRNAVFLAVGTGIGAGILVDGTILRGYADIAGATGWMALERSFREEYISCGCFEYHSSGEGIAKVTRDYLQKTASYNGPLRQKDISSITAHDVFDVYPSGDLIAVKVLEEAIQYWGMAAANYVSVFNPEKIIFGGGIFGPASQFIDRIRVEAQKWGQPISIHQVSIECSKLGGNAGLIGAGKIALSAIQSSYREKDV